MNLDRVIAVRSTKTVYRDRNLCIKVFNSDYSKADVLNEALIQARVEETLLHIPKIEAVTTIDGKWAIVSDFIKGKTLAQLMEAHPEKKQEYLELLVKLQLEMHSQSSPLLNKLKDKMNRKIEEADISESTKYNLHTRLEAMPSHEKLCHGDFNPSNIIIEEATNIPYILDWSHATQGNASADAARTYLLFCLNGDQEAAEAYLDLFCQMSHTEKRYVQKWMPLVAASQSVNGNAHEREFLLSWLDIVDYE